MSAAVSVLVPCYNVENYLRQCLDSVVSQTLRDMEILCINDGSTDGTPDILREYAARDPRIRILDKENSGYGDSMNRALDMAGGEYIGIVESDDWADADMFERLYAAAKEHDCDLVKSNFYDYCGGVSTLNGIIPPDDAEQVIRPRDRAAVFREASFIWTGLYRREWLDRHAIRFLPTPGASYQDVSFNFKTLACAERAFFLKSPFVHYRRDNENSSVKSAAKVWAVCDEHHEVERFLAGRSDLAALAPLALLMKYQSYYWNFRRLSMHVDREFCLKASEEFRRDFEKGRVREQLFKPKHYRRLRRWAFHPRLFLLDELFSGNGRKKLAQALRGGK